MPLMGFKRFFLCPRHWGPIQELAVVVLGGISPSPDLSRCEQSEATCAYALQILPASEVAAFDVAGVTTSVMLRPSLTINLLIILGMRELGFRAGVCHGRGYEVERCPSFISRFLPMVSG